MTNARSDIGLSGMAFLSCKVQKPSWEKSYPVLRNSGRKASVIPQVRLELLQTYSKWFTKRLREAF